MAYAHKVVRVTLFGTMFNGAEEWSTGFFMGHEGEDAVNPTEAVAEDIWDLWSAFFNHDDTGISWAWLATGVKLSLINTNGTTDTGNVVTFYPSSATAGGYEVTGHPPQVALVASLIAGVGKGPGMKGRMFIPGVSHPIMGDGHMATDKTQAVSLKFQTFINGVNDVAGLPGFVINASKGRVSPALAPLNKVITEIRVGNVFDTQRRRRNQLAEAYSGRTIDTAP